MPEILLDEAVKLYVQKFGANGNHAINYNTIAKIVDSQQSVVWRQIHRAGKINAESFLRLMVAMDNCWLDREKNLLVIGITGDEPHINIIDRFTNTHFKKNYTEGI